MARLIPSLLLFPALLCAQPEGLFIESTAQGAVKINIAIKPFSPKTPGLTQKPADLPWKVIANDLALSGRFTVTETASTDTALFRSKNIAVYIDGLYDFHEGKVILDGLLYDALSGNLIVAKQYSVEEGRVRRAAHLFSDEVVYRLFGDKGIASTRLVCVEKAGKAKEISIVDYDGAGKTRVTNNGWLNLTPAWSPDGKGVVYTSYRQQTPALYVTWIYTGKTDRLTKNNRLNFAPVWNGVEDKIAFASSMNGDCAVYTMEKDGSGLKRLTFHAALESSPSFSPNGYEIAYTSDRTGNPQIYIMDNEGTGTRRLTYEGKYNDAPSWSPKGDRIAYMSMADGRFDIYTIAIDGTDAKRLTKDAGNNEHPSYSPDGRLLVFSSTRAGGTDLYLISEDGGDPVRITFSGNLDSPEWSKY
ncbi:MAG: DPP IV N-terminal domain-containing protein [Fibrobacterota bacterium]